MGTKSCQCSKSWKKRKSCYRKEGLDLAGTHFDDCLMKTLNDRRRRLKVNMPEVNKKISTFFPLWFQWWKKIKLNFLIQPKLTRWLFRVGMWLNEANECNIKSKKERKKKYQCLITWYVLAEYFIHRYLEYIHIWVHPFFNPPLKQQRTFATRGNSFDRPFLPHLIDLHA